MLHGLSWTSSLVAVFSALPSCVLVPAAENSTNLQGDTINKNIPHTFEPFQDHFLPLVSPFLLFSCPPFSAVLPVCVRSSQNAALVYCWYFVVIRHFTL